MVNQTETEATLSTLLVDLHTRLDQVAGRGREIQFEKNSTGPKAQDCVHAAKSSGERMDERGGECGERQRPVVGRVGAIKTAWRCKAERKQRDQ